MNIFKILQIVNAIPLIILQIQSLKNTSGKAKAKIVEEQAMQALRTSMVATGGQVADEKKFKSGVKKITDGIVMCFKATVWGAEEVPEEPVGDQA